MVQATWHLLVRIEGEWEGCDYERCSEAQTVFSDLLSDYPVELELAVLIGPNGEIANLTRAASAPQLVN